MKRDMDLVRYILIRVGDSSGYVDARDLLCDKYSDLSQIHCHIKIMTEAGLIESKIISGWNNEIFESGIITLTWNGNEFLDVVSNDTVWHRTKSKVLDTVGNASIDVFKSVATGIISSMLG